MISTDDGSSKPLCEISICINSGYGLAITLAIYYAHSYDAVRLYDISNTFTLEFLYKAFHIFTPPLLFIELKCKYNSNRTFDFFK